jgi:alcohol dehydrogenase (cytochrome c)
LRKRLVIVLVVVAIASAALGLSPWRKFFVPVVGLAINYIRHVGAPAGSIEIENAPPTASGVSIASATRTGDGAAGITKEWPTFNGSLDSRRFSALDQINRSNVDSLKILCTYDTKEYSSIQTGLLVVNGSLIGTTEHDIFSIDAATCGENWRTREAPSHVTVNRGAAYLDGLLFRGTGDGQIIAYDFKTGQHVWTTSIANGRAGESVTAAPIGWNGMVFIGNAGGDEKGVKGRVYALDAKTGKILWEFYLVPKSPTDTMRGPQAESPLDTSTWHNDADTPITGGGNWTTYTLDARNAELYVPAGNSAPDFAASPRRGANLFSGSVVVLDANTGAYKRHFQVTGGDWHDWDVSNAPVLLDSEGGKRVLVITPKDGFLYGFDLGTSALLYRTPVTTIENAQAPFATDKGVHFCPGARGGGEWNGATFDPATNLVFVGEVDWCSTVRLASAANIRKVANGAVWSAMATRNPYNTYGVQDSYRHWGGWIYASDADTGKWRWRARLNYPVQSALTATAGGLLFFGDMGGNFYALDTASGRPLWQQNLGGALAGGVVTYAIGDAQKLAVATGFTAILWPTAVTTAKIVILDVPIPQ